MVNQTTFLSICSGIESASVAWEPLGFKCIGVSEIDPFRSELLKYHYPEVKNYGDFTKIQKRDIGKKPDIIVGGTPCATFSIAGLRKGIKSDRGNLALEFIRIIKRLNPKWVLWENVPGVLSSNNGKDFGSFLGGLAECGYGFAYRVLDTQYIRTQRFPRAIPQMRRRVFVVGHIGNWRRASEVLFDEESLSWNPPPCRKEGSGVTTKTQECSIGSDQYMKFRSSDFGRYVEDNVSSTIKARDYKSATDLITDNSVICFEPNTADGFARVRKEEVSPTLNAMTGGNRQPCVALEQFKIRRLTPIECERLQGFPDNYTQIPYRGKVKENCPSSKRYEACGRAMSINVMEWLGTRIKKINEKYN